MAGPNDFCINYKWGCRLWGKISTQKEVDEIVKSETVEYLGAYTDRNSDVTYSVYNTTAINYFVPR